MYLSAAFNVTIQLVNLKQHLMKQGLLTFHYVNTLLLLVFITIICLLSTLIKKLTIMGLLRLQCPYRKHIVNIG